MTAGQGAAGQGLHLSILAWAARHAVNKGLVKYEAASEKFSSQSTTLVDTRMRDLFDGDGNKRRSGEVPSHEKDREYMTLLAANLMLMQFKVNFYFYALWIRCLNGCRYVVVMYGDSILWFDILPCWYRLSFGRRTIFKPSQCITSCTLIFFWTETPNSNDL